MNRVKTVILLGLLTGLLIAAGGAIGGRSGLMIALVLAVAMNFFSYWYSDKIVLGMYRARPVSPDQAPELYGAVRELARNAGLPMPRVYIIDNDTPNAFATGRDPEHAVVAVTSGLLRTLNLRELKGVLAHELGHVKDRDILVSSVAATIAGAVMVLASIARFSMFFGGGGGNDNRGGGLGVIGLLVMSILAPLAALVIQMAISRSREYLADREGAEISRDPEALANALAKLEQSNRARPMAEARPQTAHMFIVSPLAGGLAGLFSTHPPIAERIARLRNMAGLGPAPKNTSEPKISPPPPPSSRPKGGGNSGGDGLIDWS